MLRTSEPIVQVIERGFCVGCGACSAIDSSFKVQLAPNGEYRVLDVPAHADLASASRVCPFAAAPDEDALAESFLPGTPKYYDGIGKFQSLYAGYSVQHRGKGGSGGLTRWLLSSLLSRGEVEYVVQVNRKLPGAESGEDLFYYAVHGNAEEYLAHTSTSAYYPVTLSKLFEVINRLDGSCAVTALPCFARALRALMLEDAHYRAKIKYISGIICGSLKSARYAEFLASQMGVGGSEIDSLDFRGKSLSQSAKEKCVDVWAKGDNNRMISSRVQDLQGTNYGQGFFKYKACDYCDDVLAETADIAFGDAWIEPYIRDPQGTNVVVVRSEYLARLFEVAAGKGEIVLQQLSPEDVVKSQAGGLRHRRDGLAVRLQMARLIRAWTPRKRVQPSWRNPVFVALQLVRLAIRRVTASAFVSVQSPSFRLLASMLSLGHGIATRLNGAFGKKNDHWR